MEDAASLEREGRDQLERATTAAELEDARVETLGRSSALTLALRELGELPAELRGARGQDLNRVRTALEELHAGCARLESRELDAALRAAAVDVTLPGDPVPRGTAHLLTQIQREIEDVFVGLGFRIAEGPEVELEYYNFTALNTPDDHPSKAESDTLWIGPGVCLRTQTSPVQVRVMESQPPPVYVICPGRVYRRDALDPTHSPMFQQVEGLAVDRGLSLAHLKGTLEHFARALFGPDREIRLRAHYFPFTEPSVELDICCFLCGGAGCRVCRRAGSRSSAPAWSTRTFRIAATTRGLPAGRSAWAERIAMLKYGIPHVRASTKRRRFLSSSAGPSDEGHAAMAGRSPRRGAPLDELIERLSSPATRSRASSAAGCRAGRRRGADRRRARARGRQAPERRSPAALPASTSGRPRRVRSCAGPGIRRGRHRGRRAARRRRCWTGAASRARSCAARPPTA